MQVYIIFKRNEHQSLVVNDERERMKMKSTKIEKNAKISLLFLILSSFIFILVGTLAEKAYDNNGIEDAMAFAIPGIILTIGGIITSFVFALKSLQNIKNNEDKLKGKKLVYVIIVINILLLLMMFA